jgi:hypothetical protein
VSCRSSSGSPARVKEREEKRSPGIGHSLSRASRERPAGHEAMVQCKKGPTPWARNRALLRSVHWSHGVHLSKINKNKTRWLRVWTSNFPSRPKVGSKPTGRDKLTLFDSLEMADTPF